MEQPNSSLEDRFIEQYLAKNGESVSDAKERLAKERALCMEKQKAEKAKETGKRSNGCERPLFKAWKDTSQEPSLDDHFIAQYLVREGESVADAKKRLEQARLQASAPIGKF